MMTSWCGDVSPLLALHVQNLPVTSGFPAQSARNVELWSFLFNNLLGLTTNSWRLIKIASVIGAWAALLQCRVTSTDLDLFASWLFEWLRPGENIVNSANLITCSMAPNWTTGARGQRAKSSPEYTSSHIWVIVCCLYGDNDYINQLWLGVNLPWLETKSSVSLIHVIPYMPHSLLWCMQYHVLKPAVQWFAVVRLQIIPIKFLQLIKCNTWHIQIISYYTVVEKSSCRLFHSNYSVSTCKVLGPPQYKDHIFRYGDSHV